MSEIIVVGAGFSGSILARKIAEELNEKVRVIEKRDHIGGNAYDEYDNNGILVQKYGPHFINTDNYGVVKFLSKYGDLYPHDTKLLSFIDNNYVRLPFNFKTLQQLVGFEKSESLLAKFRMAFVGRDRVPIFEILEHKDSEISEYGCLLFEKAYRTYTAKQWGLDPLNIDKSVIERVPMAMNFDERYLNKDFQFLPKSGYHAIFERMLDHPNILVELNTNAFDKIDFDKQAKKITYGGNQVELLIFTGAIDELFDFQFGELPYRSLNIKYDYYNCDYKLPCEIVSYPQADGYTRSTEYKRIMQSCKSDKTVVATEYPVQYKKDSVNANVPYYPIITMENKEKYLKYLEEASCYDNIVLCGRLAEYKYYNMDVCIEHALEKFEKIKVNWRKL